MSEMITASKLEESRKAFLAEVGTEAPCPICKTPRFQMSDYIRCRACAINWLAGEDLSANPKIARFREMVRQLQKQAKTAPQDAL